MQPRFNNLAAWLQWQESHHPSAIDLGLERVQKVAKRLDLLAPNAQVITVAGTNGKGSCIPTLEALMAAGGKRFGAYTSPHFLHYNERVRLQGEPVSDALLCDAFARIDAACEGISLTYFEFGTLAAMVIFNDQPLDVWLLEVGLGGRLDAVNIIAPTVAVVTSIALDHEAWLGNTREQIGYEKAGICRAGHPFICSDPEPPASVIAHATALHCPSVYVGQDFRLAGSDLWPSLQAVKALQLAEGEAIDLTCVHLPKPSVAAALEAAACIGALPAKAQVDAALANVRLMGRMQAVMCNGQQVLLDVAHNPAAAEFLASSLRQRDIQGVQAVVAMMQDKDILATLAPLVPLVTHWHCVTLPNNPRAATPQVLMRHLVEGLGVAAHRVTQGQTVAQALRDVDAPPALGLVLVYGSFFTVADAMACMD